MTQIEFESRVSEIHSFNSKQARELAKEYKVKSYSKMKKDDLIDILVKEFKSRNTLTEEVTKEVKINNLNKHILLTSNKMLGDGCKITEESLSEGLDLSINQIKGGLRNLLELNYMVETEGELSLEEKALTEVLKIDKKQLLPVRRITRQRTGVSDERLAELKNDERVASISSSTTLSKKEKVLSLKSLGVTKQEQEKLDFCHPTYIYELFRDLEDLEEASKKKD